MSTPPTTPPPTLTGHEPITVRFTDGHEETLQLCELSLRELHAFLTAMDREDSSTLVELSMRREKGWADTLTAESAAEVLERATQVNFTKAMRVAAKDASLALKLQPIVARTLDTVKQAQAMQELEAELRNVVGSTLSSPPSPAPLPSASVGETGSVSST